MTAKKKGGLGSRGLESIFGADVGKVLDDIENSSLDVPGRREVILNISDVRPNPYQPRKDFDPEALNELAESIKLHGIFTPLLVRKSVNGYDLIAGERRLRAARIAGLDTVPCIAVDFTDEQMMEISILENVQREDLNAIEEAQAYDALIKKFDYTQEKLAERVGKSREYCANIMRLLRLPSEIQQMVVDKKLTAGHVRPLLGLKSQEDMLEVAQHIYSEKLSVRQVEQLVKTFYEQEEKEKKPKQKPNKSVWVQDVEKRMRDKLGTKVDVGKKSINISFTDTDDLNRILEILGCIEESI